MRTALLGIAFSLLGPLSALAQQTPMQQALPVPKSDFRWDFLVRYDKVEGIPRTTPLTLERTRLQIRPGILFTPQPWFTVEARLAGHLDSHRNDEYPLADGSSRVIVPLDHLQFTGRHDNFRPNSIALDRLNIQLRPTSGALVTAGKFENPFDTTEALWDRDLQPEGAAGSYDFGNLEHLHSRVTAGAFIGTQLYGDKSVITGGQYSLLSGSSWPVDVALSAGYYDFSNLDVMARRNRRENATAVVAGTRQYLSDYELGDLLLRVGTDRVAGTPMRVYLDRIHNFGAANHRADDGFETGIVIGPFPGPVAARVSYIHQELDRDAVMDAFNGDDWYLHSWYRGNLYRLSIPVWRDFAVQGTYIDMQHEETNYRTTRWMVDLLKRF